ncbi:MAG: lamin tail domain-containing protein [Tannerella sp.]|jgi:Na+-transporting methylmalonyl-CoA/oxaloacetate decarboxylase gamma subunit|nr:lamin tail domain-containing protein [Tannerella sp.]
MKNINYISKLGILILLLCFVAMQYAVAQQVTAMRINEVLVINETNFTDDYSNRHAWIELYNTSAGTVNLAGCFLTNDRNNPTKYSIPKGDILTKIPPRQHTLFWADGDPDKGTFHVSFKLDPTKENYVALYDADGKTLVDEIVIPAGQIPDRSYGRKTDGKPEWIQLGKVTPSTNNITLDKNDKIGKFKEHDPEGAGMTLTAMGVVFSALLLLFCCFKCIGKVAIKASKRNAEKAHAATVSGGHANGHSTDALESGDIVAAISMALYEATEDVHDLENTVLTINKVTRRYSPWSSKIYGLRTTLK